MDRVPRIVQFATKNMKSSNTDYKPRVRELVQLSLEKLAAIR